MAEKTLSAGRGALFLTVVGTVSQLLSFGYRVMLSRLVGAEVMGLYQLVMPVYSVLLSLTAVGLTAALSNLAAHHLALGNRLDVARTRATCLKAFFLLLLPVGAVVVLASDAISVELLGDARTQLGLVLLVPCVALTGVENLHKNLFYGAGLVRAPAIVELLEQVVRAVAVAGLLVLFLPQYPERVIGLIVLGMVLCEVFSACTLLVLYRRSGIAAAQQGGAESGRVRRRRVSAIALPVGCNALLGNLMSAANSTLIPQKLVEGGVERVQAVSQFGIVCGMTMPMLALPTVFLGALSLVLVPRLARAKALDRPEEVRRLLDRAVGVVSVLTLPAMALMVVLGPGLGQLMFRQEVDRFLPPLAAVMAMSCFCSVLASGLNGIGEQRAVAAVSLLGGGLQLGCTLALIPLPGVGMAGYVVGALAATALELGLYLHLAVKSAGLRLRMFHWVVAPGLSAALSALTANLLLRRLEAGGAAPACAGIVVLLFGLVVYLAALQAQGICLRDMLRARWK